MTVLLKLILAHLLGDFILQSNNAVAQKEAHKHKAPALYLHVVFHAFLSWLFIFKTDFWWGAIVILVSHYLIDLSKLTFQKENNKRTWFFADQMMHLSVILAVWIFYTNANVSLQNIFSTETLLILTAILFLTTPTSTIIDKILSTWDINQINEAAEPSEKSISLPNAGSIIGILERLLIFTFIAVNQWSGVGFILAAKSIFRFGDLNRANERALTEYVIIGTLVSFGIAIVAGVAFVYSL